MAALASSKGILLPPHPIAFPSCMFTQVWEVESGRNWSLALMLWPSVSTLKILSKAMLLEPSPVVKF